MFISEIAKILKITTRTIRHYEEAGIINSKRLENNYRYFDAENIDKIKFLIKSRKLGFSLKECKELIKLLENKTRKSKNVRNITKKKIKVLSEQIKELEGLKKSLQWLLLKCPGDEKPDCPIINQLKKNNA
ncbi:MerR family transcriptional regulator [Alphaproteobacteria bacterium]|nr:MerR family transcriptional regulator [Alphaproteobacteria bacterium]